MGRIKKIKDVVDWGLCMGCGACYYYCNKKGVTLININSIGIRPIFDSNVCLDCKECLTICPGYNLNAKDANQYKLSNIYYDSLIGSTLEVWEGYASDTDLRHAASSGGILTALSLYCLEMEDMNFILHTGMDPLKPWENKTITSFKRNDLLRSIGSRYAPSSPCESLRLIEESEKPCVFIGKPCDVAAVSMLRRIRPKLDKNLGLVLSFFCAGPPCTQGTLDLIKQANLNLDEVTEVHYRGKGWPGGFRVIDKNGIEKYSLTYRESWGFLAKYPRSFRCHLCPDGLGEFADISCGDAWHKYSKEDDNRGLSLALARSEKGKVVLQKALNAGYLTLSPAHVSDVALAQNNHARRSELFGRLLAMRMLRVPVPNFKGFHLFSTWAKISIIKKLRTVVGTLRRLLSRGLWHRNPLKIA